MNLILQSKFPILTYKIGIIIYTVRLVKSCTDVAIKDIYGGGTRSRKLQTSDGGALSEVIVSFLGLAEIELEALMSPPCLDPGSSISMTHGL